MLNPIRSWSDRFFRCPSDGLKGFAWPAGGERGFTLIELLVVAAVGSLLAVGASTIFYQIFIVNGQSITRMDAVKQLENTLYLINRDAQMAQQIQATGTGGFPLTLTWVNWDNVSSSVVYSLSGSNVIRSESVDGGTPVVTIIARDVLGGETETNCQFADGVLSLTMSVQVTLRNHTSTEVRSLKISPRPVA